MPYFVYKVHGARILELMQPFEKYRDARQLVKELRQHLAPDSTTTARLVFAPDDEHAQRILLERRDARPIGEDA